MLPVLENLIWGAAAGELTDAPRWRSVLRSIGILS
jgi:hypothetical protein